ncbi:MAG: hypothetical protein PHR35_20540, partial [Kiritimatiellae bacterium]|nr:hypothetical protein [Kiritimatiellia bacterium]
MRTRGYILVALAAGLAIATVRAADEAVELDPSGMLHRRPGAEATTPSAGAAAAPDRPGPNPPEPSLIHVPLASFATATNCVVDHGRVWLNREPRQDAEGCLVMEAEEASRLTPEEGRTAVGFDAADGCRFAANVMDGTYDFVLGSGGVYRTWYRAWFPLAGRWNHTETLDGGVRENVTDSLNGPTGRWVWVQGPTRSLAAGPHRLALDYQGGARLDKMALAPESFVPTGRGPTARYARADVAGRVETPVLAPVGVAQWRSLAPNALGGGGTVAAFCSPGNKESWEAVAPDGSLPATVTTATSFAGLRVALDLVSGTNGVTPMLVGPALCAATAPPLAFGNDRVNLMFSRSGGDLVGVRDLVISNTFLASAGRPHPLVMQRTLQGGTLEG